MRVALVTTVRNERTLLRDNLRFHHWLGVERSFVFLDQSTDGTGDSVRDLPGVVVTGSADGAQVPARFAGLPLVRLFTEKLRTHHTARQMLNTLVATDWARDAGCDWIVSLDPDELLCPSLRALAPDDLLPQLARVPSSAPAVRFLPLEVLPLPDTTSASPFRRAVRFKNRFNAAGGAFEHAYRFPRMLHDPYRGEDWLSTDYLGHTAGKSAVRTTAGLVPATVHGFVGPDGVRPAVHPTGWLLHYCNATFERFLTRFRHRRGMPARWAGGAAVDPSERLWQAMVNDGAFTEAQLEAYFREQIVPSEATVVAWRAAAPDCVVEVAAVREAFAAIDANAPG